MFLEHRPEYASEVAAPRALAEKPGCSPDSLRVWARQVRRDADERPGPTRAEKARIRELERENRELRQANEILKKGEPAKAPLMGWAAPAPDTAICDVESDHPIKEPSHD